MPCCPHWMVACCGPFLTAVVRLFELEIRRLWTRPGRDYENGRFICLLTRGRPRVSVFRIDYLNIRRHGFANSKASGSDPISPSLPKSAGHFFFQRAGLPVFKLHI
ncbi:hypothetical protein VTL71DRAFT_6111 [Oculimacula yallundae]|uniref:Secreted protein n=1 Tax=Oculimacula yallundae TaxID=86028 RepID=A0ABR4BZE6_9HELO